MSEPMRTNTDATCATCHAHIRLTADGYEPHDCPHKPTAGVNDGPRAFRDGADDAPDKSKGAAGPIHPASRPAPAVTTPEPIETGWYTYSGGMQVMIFHLRETGQWSAHFDNGTAHDCAWGYIEQALGVWDLVKIPEPNDVRRALGEDGASK